MQYFELLFVLHDQIVEEGDVHQVAPATVSSMNILDGEDVHIGVMLTCCDLAGVYYSSRTPVNILDVGDGDN
jgi:hypothetical protein